MLLQHVAKFSCIGLFKALVFSLYLTTDASASDAMETSLDLVHPELLPAAEQLLKYSVEMPAINQDNLHRSREGRPPTPPRLDDVPVEKQVLTDLDGIPDLTLYVINARSTGKRPAILHTHGGGFILGSAESDVPRLQRIARALDCVIVTVDYRLAPEVTYEGSVEDNYAGLSWLYHNAESLGADPQRIALMGESAGGGHAALLAFTARDRGEIPVVFQMLVYPMLDDRSGSSREVPAHIGQLLWTRESNRFGWESFLGMEPGTDKVPAAAVPARIDNVKGLPPAFIGVGSLDLFVDEDIEFARRLVNAGVPTELVVVPGAFHGFDLIAAETAVGEQFNRQKMNALKRAFEIAGKR